MCNNAADRREYLVFAAASTVTRLPFICRDILEKILGPSDDKSVVGILGKINSLRVGTQHV